MGFHLTQVDAFTDQPFAGNPAAVVILPEPQTDSWLQNVAREMNLSETAFLLRQDDGFQLRWFTPTVEVPLCGHATLASAHALWAEGYLAPTEEARFHTLSGVLTAKKQGDWIELNFPPKYAKLVEAPAAIAEALGVPFTSVSLTEPFAYVVEVESEEIVRSLQPNFALLRSLPAEGVIVTSRASTPGFDFVSRFFAPNLGINEDPVTGAAHCCLATYWSDRLGKSEFLAYQASERGGVLRVRYDGTGDRDQRRVCLSGQAVTVMRGELVL
ncbi:PhzF family phenazine biosynthesis protein [Oscillatoria sp. FACHB-1407]|uniref:PhzF family phenazine biosynthesis protein n=1 Tax=Oscillatoria sp. FACHB-1407 TaxID=2692847 RepID=UPI0016860FF6|nr:PhzF family phenazine biosynthesis protein [Oscillatoria sp. FACHB-1407]MBD2464564.1 PhzF family phenazine biosynthesis protein [Oscillatoria sp. FACHB-1407]